MKYARKPLVVEATRWFKNSDHPDDACRWLPEKSCPLCEGSGHDAKSEFYESGFVPLVCIGCDGKGTIGGFLSEGKIVRYFRHPNVPGATACNECHRTMHDHGWIDSGGEGRAVCPGDYVVTMPDGQRWPMVADQFEQNYESIPEETHDG